MPGPALLRVKTAWWPIRDISLRHAARARSSHITRAQSLLLVGAVLAIAVALRVSRIAEFHNTYYMAVVRSMLYSPSNFLFGSFDPGGVVMVDKPPAAFWLQAMFASLFEVTPWAVNLPQTILGTLTVLVLYQALTPSFGRFDLPPAFVPRPMLVGA